MSAFWNLYRFQYSRLLEVRPRLRIATRPEEFAALSNTSETDAIVEALVDNQIDPVDARQAFLIAICCEGEPLPCPKQLPKILLRLRGDVRTEAGTELLTDAVAGGRNMDTWLRPTGKLAGFLTPDETISVYEAYRMAETRRLTPGLKRRRRVRRGGVVPTFTTFVRRVFDRGPAADEVYRLLGELLEEAVESQQGVAVVTV